MTSAITDLEPKRLWEYFAALSVIPRCSKHEEQAASFIVDEARRLGLEVEQASVGNVLVRKNGTKGRENAPIVALQSHLDMVCEKNNDTVHDFSNDPLTLKRNGNYLSADGTTLGADNGIGVATALALMECSTVKHGPIEFLFTVDEETGLNGALGLQPEFLRAGTLINLDSEELGVLFVGCAGGVDSVGTLPIEFHPMPARHNLYKVKVTGLRGGHSGLEIHAGRANAIKLLNRAVAVLGDLGARICSMTGGNKRNAIPREAEAIVAVPENGTASIGRKARELDLLYKKELAVIDNGVSLSIEQVEGTAQVMKPGMQNRLVDLIYALPHGVIAMNPEIPGLVETSTNLAVITTTKRSVEIATSQRSAVESEKLEIMRSVHAAFSLAGATVSRSDGYPGWKPNLQSPILKIAQEVYRRQFGHDAEVKAVHAGLECGIIGEKYPTMDMVSLGPTMQMVHSPEERVEIESVGKFWEFLCGILEGV
jgi:dipeptidase D